jgi:hypothetical protein
VPEAAPVDAVVALTARLRAAGVRAGTGQIELALRALAAVDSGSREEARLALRTVLCARRGDLRVFDAVFAELFGGADDDDGGLGPLVPPPGGGLVMAQTPAGEPPADAEAEDPELRPAAYSDVELLLDKDFAAYTDTERAAARVVLERIAQRLPRRRSRRMQRASHGPRVDVRRTLRAAARTGGEPLKLHRRGPGVTRRRLVLVCDVSGSMAPYARMLLAYMHAAVRGHRRVEAFAFGTRLTRITRELDERDPDRALARATAAACDLGGGTRIGAALAALNREHGRRLGRGAIVVVLSDGWDRGDADVMAAEMARLRRSAHGVVWLNPLKASPGYEPLARGMTAALPYVDHFLEGHSLRSLIELADLLEGGLDE